MHRHYIRSSTLPFNCLWWRRCQQPNAPNPDDWTYECMLCETNSKNLATNNPPHNPSLIYKLKIRISTSKRVVPTAFCDHDHCVQQRCHIVLSSTSHGTNEKWKSIMYRLFPWMHFLLPSRDSTNTCRRTKWICFAFPQLCAVPKSRCLDSLSSTKGESQCSRSRSYYS